MTNYTGKTDANGECTISDVPEGTYTLTASKEGYVDYTGTITVPGENDEALEITLEESNLVNLPIKALIMTSEGINKLNGGATIIGEELVGEFDSSEVIEYLSDVTVCVTHIVSYENENEVITQLDSPVSCTTGNAGGCTLRGLPELSEFSGYLFTIDHDTYTTSDCCDFGDFDGVCYGYIVPEFVSNGQRVDGNGNYLIIIPLEEWGESSEPAGR